MKPRQKQILDAIRDLSAEGVSPSLQDIADRVGLSSRSNVHNRVEELIAMGRVTRGGRYESRTLRVVGEFSPQAIANMSHADMLALRAAIDARLNHGASA